MSDIIKANSVFNLYSWFPSITKKICWDLCTSRYEFPWWKEKEIVSEKKRLDGLCPLTPEETALVLQALGFKRDTLIYIASGGIYGGERRLAALRTSYPKIVSVLSLGS
ncbi:hypothetical protein B296_00027747 [Ensete ventricosum]|uniref:O-fucosyltransferase family protein n=1 Tax=Ensete ventricosum TaxID=4639 RepID=A0A426YDN9_ENSVE|nr:hypothetical protein B296_00027747 [Ensete ventricosum]